MAITSHEPPSDEDIVATGRDGLKDARKHNRGREDVQRRMRNIIRDRQGGLGINDPNIFYLPSHAKIAPGSRPHTRFTAAASNFPTSWNERLRQYTVYMHDMLEERAYLRPAEDEAYEIGDDGKKDSMLHEMAHLMQHAMPELDAYFQRYHRALGELRTEPLGARYDGEFTQWRRRVNGEPVYAYNYFGKVYDDDQKPLEVMPMSMQALLGNGDKMFYKFIQKNWDLASLTLGLLLWHKP